MAGVVELPRPVALWVLAAAGFSLIPHLLSMPWYLGLPLVLLMGWRTQHGYRPLHWITRTALVLLAVFAVAMIHDGLWGRLPGSQLLAAMVALKSMELKRKRDAMLMVSLSFFVVATWFLFDQSPLAFGYLVISVWTSLSALVAVSRARRVAEPPRKCLQEGLRMALPALPLALVLFLFFPRLSSPLWGIYGGDTSGVTGLSSSMSPGSVSALFMDDGPAFRVTFEGTPPPPQQRYWRGPVLWEFDGRTWTRFFFSNVPAPETPPPSAVDYRYTVELEPHQRRWLFALDYPASYPEQAELKLDYQLLADQPITNLRRYSISSDTDFIDSPRLPATLRQAALQLPEGAAPRARELAGGWRREADTTEAVVERALRYFRTKPFYYRLDTPVLGQDPVDEFLFETRAGYCEHYAGAFTVLMRAAGIPARVVTGYQGGIGNGDYMLVRQSDAHAWAEVWLQGKGWTRIDPTTAVAPSRVERGSRSAVAVDSWLHAGWIVQLRNRLDRVRHWWNQTVVSFDAGRQSQLLRPFGIEDAAPQQLVLALGGLMAIILLAILFWIRRQIPAGAPDPVQRHYRRLLRRLRRAGVTWAASEGPLEIERRALGTIRGQRHRVRRAFALYRGLRYGRLPATELASFRAAVTDFRPRSPNHKRQS